MRLACSDHVFPGNDFEARDLELLNQHRIIAVTDVALNEPPTQLSHDMICCRIPLEDGDGNCPDVLKAAIRCLAVLFGIRIRLLVTCSAGMNRSPAIIAAAVTLMTRQHLGECLRSVTKEGPHDVSPVVRQSVRGALSRRDDAARPENDSVRPDQ